MAKKLSKKEDIDFNFDEREEELELAEVQPKSKPSPADRIKPYQYKKGQSGNPAGRAKGISLKEYVKRKFRLMTDEEREEYLEGLSKDFIWEMGESKAKQDLDANLGGEVTIKLVNYGDK